MQYGCPGTAIATLKQSGIAAPPYAYYPTANRFLEAFAAEERASCLTHRGICVFALASGLYAHTPLRRHHDCIFDALLALPRRVRCALNTLLFGNNSGIQVVVD